MAIKPINHYSITTPASVYDEEALTALELAGRTAAKVNECVDTFNKFETDTNATIESHKNEVDKRLDAQDANIPVEVATAITTNIANGMFDRAIGAYIGELDEQVEHLVNNIPVEVATAITTNIANGMFDRAIGAYIGELDEQVEHLVNNIPEGGTTMDAEIIAARQGDTGIIYKNLRESIRGQIDSKMCKTPIFDDINRFNPKMISTGVYLKPESGDIAVNAEYNTSDFIPVKGGETIHINHNKTPLTARFVLFYTEVGNLFCTYYADVSSFMVPVTGYMRFSYSATYSEYSIMVSRPYYGLNHINYGEAFNYKVDDATPYITAYGNRYNPTNGRANVVVGSDDGRTRLNNSDTVYVTTHFIPILQGETLKVCNNKMETQTIRTYACYDENFNFIDSSGGEYVTKVTQNGSCKYVRFTFDVSIMGNAIICSDTQVVYLKYGEFAPINSTEGSKQLISMLGGGSVRLVADTIASDSSVSLPRFPAILKKNVSFCFNCRFDNSFATLIIGQGKSENAYGGLWYQINASQLTIHRQYDNTYPIDSVNHGLNINKRLCVCVVYDNEGGANITLSTSDGTFTHSFETGFDVAGKIFVSPESMSLSNCTLSASCVDFSKPLWIVGDSYCGYANDRVMGQLKNLGFNNFLCLAQAGLKSPDAVRQLETALEFGTPKYLIWYMGMNDGSTADTYEESLNRVKELCEERNITLILNKVPTVPGITKEAISTVIDNSGCRFINSYQAVGSNPYGYWTYGLSSDNVHPTEQGAIILATQVLLDVPEIMSYGGN